MDLRITTDVSSEILTKAQVKNFLKISNGTTDDDLIDSMIKQARELCERYTDCVLALKTIEARFTAADMDNGVCDLPLYPHICVDSVKRIDYKRTETSLTYNSEYYVYGQSRKTVEVSQVWSTGVGNTLPDDIVITIKAGYGHNESTGNGYTKPEALPEAFKQAMYMQIQIWYGGSEDYIPVLDDEVKKILTPYKRASYLG